MKDIEKRCFDTSYNLEKKGYIEATPEVIKEYFDAIVYSGRDKI